MNCSIEIYNADHSKEDFELLLKHKEDMESKNKQIPTILISQKNIPIPISIDILESGVIRIIHNCNVEIDEKHGTLYLTGVKEEEYAQTNDVP